MLILAQGVEIHCFISKINIIFIKKKKLKKMIMLTSTVQNRIFKQGGLWMAGNHIVFLGCQINNHITYYYEKYNLCFIGILDELFTKEKTKTLYPYT